MGKFFKRLLTTIVILAVLLVGGGLWLKSYVAPQQDLDMRYEPIDLKAKALDMVKRLSPELVLTEADVNNLLKMQMGSNQEDIYPDMKLNGAAFELKDERLLAHLNVTYRDKIPVGLLVTYKLVWKAPNVVLEPIQMSVRGVKLPHGSMEKIVIPLGLSADDIVGVGDVRFESDKVMIRLKVNL
ncbi:hypothetical protein [Paenibacillus radicis (ex Gao et al. 2016)]|uniref:DUF2140 family protein n=1 Tax=Paenibacillus radicis (ex Gao et al. 2016) TaxID=1737354 RepID=A0A917H3A7_9BACL|nr:hypothetical protein [Paenibacillus radicis (ex Gao et al. 2016)]GGG66047.1 hypothetical protein GCM10010918_20510 [Paenibacillus radicis (ex Gao et al. 2016)]